MSFADELRAITPIDQEEQRRKENEFEIKKDYEAVSKAIQRVLRIKRENNIIHGNQFNGFFYEHVNQGRESTESLQFYQCTKTDMIKIASKKDSNIFNMYKIFCRETNLFSSKKRYCSASFSLRILDFDADSISEILRNFGFHNVGYEEITVAYYDRVQGLFGWRWKKYDTTVFYYSFEF